MENKFIENWEYIKEYGELYMISNYGNIKSCGRYIVDSIGRNRYIKPKILHPSETSKRINSKKGYLEVRLTDNNGISKNHLIHILVANAFIPNINNKPTVNHIDGDKHNNYVDNLEWNTYSENNQHAYNSHLRSDNVYIGKLDKNTNELLCVYMSMHQASREDNVNISNIHAVCNGKRSMCGGYGWCYIPKTEVTELTYDELCEMKSIRGVGCLGSSGK